MKQYIEIKHIKKLTIIWHGGEPLLWGEDNFREILGFAKKNFEGINYKSSIQTNISLMSDSYIRLFKEYNVHIGFSLDGYKELNDSQRVYPDGSGTYYDIMEKVELCRNAGLSIGCIIVGSRKHIGKIKELYDFLCAHQLNFKNCLGSLEYLNGSEVKGKLPANRFDQIVKDIRKGAKQ